MANKLVDFTCDVLEAQLRPPGSRMVLLEHPEDLGGRGCPGVPGSIW